MKVVAGALLIAASALATAKARGEPDADGKTTLAETLFLKAKTLMAAHDYEHACPLLEESQRLDPADGTFLTLAICHEHQGRTATAWAEFREAEASATSKRDEDRQAVAREHLDKLEPNLSRLRVRVAAAGGARPGLIIRLDGLVLAPPVWGLDAPVDPGVHHVEAEAPGRRPRAFTITVGAAGESATVDVDELEPLAGPRPIETVKPPPPSSVRKTIAFGVLGAGVATVIVGGVFGVLTFVEQADANKRCPTTSCTDAHALSENTAARAHATIADVTIPIGLAGSAAAIVLFATAPRRAPPTTLRVGAFGPRAFVDASF